MPKLTGRQQGQGGRAAFVRTSAAKFQHRSDLGFVEAVDQHYLGQVAIVGLAQIKKGRLVAPLLL